MGRPTARTLAYSVAKCSALVRCLPTSYGAQENGGGRRRAVATVRSGRPRADPLAGVSIKCTRAAFDSGRGSATRSPIGPSDETSPTRPRARPRRVTQSAVWHRGPSVSADSITCAAPASERAPAVTGSPCPSSSSATVPRPGRIEPEVLAASGPAPRREERPGTQPSHLLLHDDHVDELATGCSRSTAPGRRVREDLVGKAAPVVEHSAHVRRRRVVVRKAPY